MSGQNAAQGHPVEGYNLHRYRGGRSASSDAVRNRTERGPGPGLRKSSPGTSGSRSLSAAQREWPEYNRVVVVATGVGVCALLITGAVVEAIVR